MGSFTIACVHCVYASPHRASRVTHMATRDRVSCAGVSAPKSGVPVWWRVIARLDLEEESQAAGGD